MKNLLNLGVSDPLTLGMTHPVADRLETLGRARPATWRSRIITLSAMSVIAVFSAPLSLAENNVDADMSHVLTVTPDMTEVQIEDLQARIESVSTGQADKSVLTDFMIQNGDRLIVRYDPKDEIIDLRTGKGFGFKRAGAEMKLMPKWLERCKSERTSNYHVMRVTSSYGASTVQCSALKLSEAEIEAEVK